MTRLVVFLALVSAVAAFLLFFRESLSLDAAIAAEQGLRSFTNEHYTWALVVAFTVYVSVTSLPLPGAWIMTLVISWLFGFVNSLILVSFASTTGATFSFLLSRYLFRDAVQSRFGVRLKLFNDALEREGAFYLFTMRLIVAVPFFVINLVMGLTPIKVRTYWWVSQLGMLPGTAVYVWAGSSVPTLDVIKRTGGAGILSWQLVTAFALLGVFPLLVKRCIAWRRPAE